MSNVYKSTTESLESLDAKACAPRLSCPGWRRSESNTGKGEQNDRAGVELSPVPAANKGGLKGQDKENDDDMARPSKPAPVKKSVSYSTHQSQTTDSDEHILGVGYGYGSAEFGSHTSIEAVPKPKLDRAKSIRQSIARGTKEFFGLSPEEERMQQKWKERRIRHCSKRYGKVKESAYDQLDSPSRYAGTPVAEDMPRGFHSDSAASKWRVLAAQLSTATRKSRRESVPLMVWNTLKRQMSTKPSDVDMLTMYGGRSFAPADLASESDEDINDVFHDSSGASVPTTSPGNVFFSFSGDESRMASELIAEGPEINSFDLTDGAGIPERSSSPALSAGWKRAQKTKAQEREKEIVAAHPRIKPAQTHLVRQPSERRHRMQHRAVVKQRERRQVGKGLVGKLLNRTLKRKRIDSFVKKQLEEITDHRPYFTYWVSFVQVVVLIVTVSVYSFAPIGVSRKTVQSEVLVNRNGVLQKERISKTVFENFWIGPGQADLIRLGAKYAPCMRKDQLLSRAIEKDQRIENMTGCCIESYNTGCIQRLRADCVTSFTKFVEFTKDAKAVCGQDPVACKNPSSVAPYKWPPYQITKWPVCKETFDLKKLSPEEYPHMRCQVTGRPCCIGNQAKCMITNQEHCHFLNGIYHPEATLCSQVDCLAATCGMLPFLNHDSPDQIYRLWLSLFLHAGVIHVVVTLVFNFTILRDMEKFAGWIRISLIYILSGVGGNLWSAVIIPYQPEVGPSGALFGIIACLFVELFQNWQIVANPVKGLVKLSVLILVLFLIGCLPYVDNFAHIFGFIYGFLLAFALLPYVYFGVWDLRRKRIQIIIALGILIAISAVGFILFYTSQEFNCPGCEYFNCVPITFDFCENSHLGQKLQPR